MEKDIFVLLLLKQINCTAHNRTRVQYKRLYYVLFALQHLNHYVSFFTHIYVYNIGPLRAYAASTISYPFSRFSHPASCVSGAIFAISDFAIDSAHQNLIANAILPP